MYYNCRICTHTNFKLFLQANMVSYYKCNNCGFITQVPLPKSAEIKDIYNDSYFDYEYENTDNFFNLMQLGLMDIQFDTIFPVPGKVLDIGCATGKLLSYLKNKGWDTQGIEICHKSAEYARNKYGLNIIEKGIEQSELNEESFDFIHTSHVIEHVEDPLDFLSNIYKILKTGGYACITTPNISSLQYVLYKKNWRSAIKQHLQLFTRETLKNTLIMTKFKIIKQISWGGVPIEIAKNKFLMNIKCITDIMVKKLNIGDVMLYLVKK